MRFIYSFLLILIAFSPFAPAQNIPLPAREFRAVWIATVDNIDFPSKKTLRSDQQKAELIRILDAAREFRFNAVVFQVRPHADALYDSKIEPWSEYLTGTSGKAPQPFYDPLAFLVKEAHKRGILVHAWFNPYRAWHPAAKSEPAPNHISRARPELVRQYGKYLWLDPTDPAVQKSSLDVILDVVRRYDVDGVHFDDYFYPYPEKDAAGNRIEFPDDKNWEEYLKHGAAMSRRSGVRRKPLSRDDWRRAQVNAFIETVGREVKKIKPEVMYGISPFAIWQPVPEMGITGFNSYAELYADARKWLREGIVDYFAPQLYWETARQGQSFPVLFDWWQQQNIKKRHLWVGIAPYRIGTNPNFTAAEIVNQISLTRERLKFAAGTIHFSMKHLQNNRGGIGDELRRKVYRREALIPESPWLSKTKPLMPVVKAQNAGKQLKISWQERGARRAFWFVVYARDASGWSYSILPASQKSIALSTDRKISQIAVSSVDRLGNESPKRLINVR